MASTGLISLRSYHKWPLFVRDSQSCRVVFCPRPKPGQHVIEHEKCQHHHQRHVAHDGPVLSARPQHLLHPAQTIAEKTRCSVEIRVYAVEKTVAVLCLGFYVEC